MSDSEINPKAFRRYYYFNDMDYPIDVTEDTCILTNWTFLRKGTLWENDSLRLFFSRINPDEKCNIIDVGAQSGLYSLYAKYLPNSTFYSFEPFPGTYKLLNDNLCVNEINNVKTYNIALSDTAGKAILNVCTTHNGFHTLGNNIKRFGKDVTKTIEVQTDTIDNMFYDKNIPVHYIKIDTEGYEYFILKGGTKTIMKYRPIIHLEWNQTNMKQCDVTPEMMTALFIQLKYNYMSRSGEERLYVPV